jgi:soluble lytic murein transglycosylase-like protein
VLKAIAMVESRMNPRAVSKERRTRNLGIMQVNSSWIPVLKRKGFDVKRIMDPCYNILVGAFVLRFHIDESGGDLWKGVGRYNAKSKGKQLRYVRKVRLVLKRVKLKNESGKENWCKGGGRDVKKSFSVS